MRPISLPSLLDPKVVDETRTSGIATGRIKTKQFSASKIRSFGEAKLDGRIESNIRFQVSANFPIQLKRLKD
jgi:hypothetical protein